MRHAKLEILAPFWAIFNVLAHLIYVLAWERSMVLYQTLEMWIFPFASTVNDVVSSIILLFVKD